MSKPNAIKFNCQSCDKPYRVPEAMAGKSARCKACGDKMQVPKSASNQPTKPKQPKPTKPAKPAKSAKSTTTPDDSFSMEDLLGLSSEAAPEPVAGDPSALASPTDAGFPFSPNVVTLPSSPKSRRKGEGLASSLTGIWQSFVSPDRASGSVPMIRRVSLGGAFLLLGGVLLLIFSSMQVPRAELDTAREILQAPMFKRASPIPQDAPLGAMGIIALIAGLGVTGRRLWAPRPEPETPLVLIIFWGITLMVAALSCLVLFGGTQMAGQVAALGSLGVLLASLVFGVWLLYRLSTDSDGSGLLLVTIPAILVPVSILIMLMANAPPGAVGQMPWGMILLSLFILFLLLMTMGGALSVLMIILTPFLLLGAMGATALTGSFSAIWFVIALCVMCYGLLIITRWRVMLKPVGWQIAILFVGSWLMGSFQKMGFDQALLADAQDQREADDAELTSLLRANGDLTPTQTASYDPFPNSGKVDVPFGRKSIAYLSTGGTIVRPKGFSRSMLDEGDEPDTNTPVATGPNGRPDRPGREPEQPPKPIFEAEVLSRGAEAEPSGGAPWPVFEVPDSDAGESREILVWGYRMQLQPGYRIRLMTQDPQSGTRLLHLLGPKIGNRDMTLKIEFVAQPIDRDGTASVMGYTQMLRAHDANIGEDYVEFGQIGTIKYARAAPSDKRMGRYGKEIVYVAQMPDAPRRIVMTISTHANSEDQILVCEAMARSLQPAERSTVLSMPDAAAQAQIQNTLVNYSADALDDPRWRINGIFAYPSSTYSGRTERDRANGLGLELTSSSRNATIHIDMVPAKAGASREMRIVPQGPEAIADPSDPFKGQTIYAYGARVSFDRLWNDAVFARVVRGLNDISTRGRYEEISYYGWLGDYWTTVRVRRKAQEAQPMSEVEAMLRQIRLANALEVYQSSDAKGWLARVLRNESADLPLADGTLLAEAFEVNALGGFSLAGEIDPDSGKLVEFFPEMTPEALQAYSTWKPDDRAKEFLGNTESFGPIEFQTLEDLRASSRNTNQQSEWFANTNSGRVRMKIRVDALGKDDTPIKAPLQLDEQTGKTVLTLGRQTLKVDDPPSIAYRESRGLRIWRMLMPQVRNAKLRRCYYVATMPGRTLVIVADFEAEAAEQLMAMDASVGSMIWKSNVIE